MVIIVVEIKETEQPVLGPGFTRTVSQAVPEFSHPQLGILPAAQFRQDRLHGIAQGQKRQRGFLDSLGPFDLAGIRSEGNILPQPVMQVYKVTLPEGDIAVIEVQPSKLPPVRFRGRIWIRVGARKAIANEEEERILIERREFNTPNFESEPCLSATLDDLDLDIFHGTLLPAMVDEKEIKKDKRPIEVQLASLGLFYIPYNCPTNAGILLIGKNPTRFIPSASIQYVQFEGLTKGTKVLNEHLFKGNLLTELKNLDNFSEYTLRRKRPQLVTALRDKTFIGYPYKATRELLMNICQHRAYNGSNSPAHVYEYADRLEFDNTGTSTARPARRISPWKPTIATRSSPA